MQIKKKNLTRLASISALGAGVVGVTTQTARADVVILPFSGNTRVGFSSAANATGFSSNVNTLVASGIGGIKLFRDSPGSGGSTYFRVWLSGLSGVKFQNAPVQGPVPSFMWNGTAATFANTILKSKRKSRYYVSGSPHPVFTTTGPGTQIVSSPRSPGTWKTRSTNILKSGLAGDFYLLFQFQTTGGQTLVGWLDLYGWDFSKSWSSGPDVSASQWAVETPVPEPATAIPAGVAALALGAVWVRRWRKSRSHQAA